MNDRLKKSRAIRDKEAVWRWGQERDTCACCHAYIGMIGILLENHHIIKVGRSDEPCNLLRLCAGPSGKCHRLAELEKVPHPQGGYYPKLKLSHCLWLKRESDPENWNPERLAELRHSALPALEAIPDVFLKERNHA